MDFRKHLTLIGLFLTIGVGFMSIAAPSLTTRLLTSN